MFGLENLDINRATEANKVRLEGAEARCKSMWWRVKPLQHPVRVELSVFDATEGEDRHYERLRITTSQFCGRILFHHLYQCICTTHYPKPDF